MSHWPKLHGHRPNQRAVTSLIRARQTYSQTSSQGDKIDIQDVQFRSRIPAQLFESPHLPRPCHSKIRITLLNVCYWIIGGYKQFHRTVVVHDALNASHHHNPPACSYQHSLTYFNDSSHGGRVHTMSPCIVPGKPASLAGRLGPVAALVWSNWFPICLVKYSQLPRCCWFAVHLLHSLLAYLIFALFSVRRFSLHFSSFFLFVKASRSFVDRSSLSFTSSHDYYFFDFFLFFSFSLFTDAGRLFFF